MVEEEVAAKVAAKIDSMQKFVPFLSKLITRLEQDPQNASKVVQMLLLHKILINTEESVSIEELNKCEQALEAIYKIYEAPALLAATAGAEEEEKSLELKPEKERIVNNEKQTTDKKVAEEKEPLSKHEFDPESSKVHTETEKENQTAKNFKDIYAEKKKQTRKSSNSDKKEDSEECKEADQIIDDEILFLIGRENDDKSIKTIDENKTETKEKKQETAVKVKQTAGINESPKAVEKNDKNNEKIKVLGNKKIEKESLEDTDINEKVFETVKDDKTKEGKPEQSKKNNKDEEREAEEKNTDQNHEEEIEEDEELDEENIELIKMPEEADDEEMILPDSADEAKVAESGKKHAEEEDTDDEVDEPDTNDKKVTNDEEVNINKNEQHKHNREVKSKGDEEQMVQLESDEEQAKDKLSGINRKEITIKKPKTASNEAVEETTEKPELVALREEEATSQVDEDDDDDEIERSIFGGYDPLTCDETNDKAKEQEDDDDYERSLNKTNANDDDDDDEIERSIFRGYDPLNCEETNDKAKEQADADERSLKNKKTKTNSVERVLQIADDDDEDDDDVEVIETRNSPICLDSDDEEAATDTTKKVPTIAVVKPQERTFARKSTAKPAAVPQVQNKPKNWAYLNNASTPIVRPQRRRVVDTIDLLDSSDDEASSSSRTQRSKRARLGTASATQSSPAKRQLLSALKKNTNKKTQPRTQPPPQLLKRAAAASAVPQMPRPVHLSTPQSNFLNAVQLQPAFAGVIPAAFSTQLCNKNVIIPNAFYGNPTRNLTSPAAATPAQRGRPRLTPKPLLPTVATEQQGDRTYRRWLENFLTHFAHPQHIASHTCFVLLQRVLKYKLFARIKETRTHLNTLAAGATEFIDIQLMLDLRSVFYTDAKQLTESGRAFCQMATSSAFAGTKPVTLTTEARSGRVSSRTRTADEMTLVERCHVAGVGGTNGGASNFSGVFCAATSSGASPPLTAGARKRQRDDVEYKPDKAHALAIMESNVDGGDSSGGERKRTLRTNRTRRFDNSFSYNEDEDPNEFEDEDDEEAAQESAEVRAAKAAVQRVIEQKRLEAQRQRERQAKSFENAFINAFSANGFLANERAAGEEGGEDNVSASTSKAKRVQQRLGVWPLTSNEASCSSSEAASTFLIHDAPNNENDDANSLEQFDEEPVQHRIYKVIPAKLTAAATTATATTTASGGGIKRKQPAQLKPAQNQQEPQPMQKKRGRPRKIAKPPSSEEEENADAELIEEEAEIITCDDFDDDDIPAATAFVAPHLANEETSNNSSNDCVVLRSVDTCVDIDPAAAPRNTDRTMCARSKNNEWCVICHFRTPRIVHHYVNLHRGCEVYTARLAAAQVARLRRPNGAVAQLHKYKNGQQQFEAACPFCEKTSRFMLPYWYQHFTMHTGEYAYRCTACGIRKPTRSLLVAHINQPCSAASARRDVATVKQDFTFDSRAAQIEARICMLCNYVQLQRANVVAHLKLQHGIKQILPKHIQSIVLLKTSAAAQPYKVKTTTAVRGSGGAVYEIEEIDDDEDDVIATDEGNASVGDNRYFNYDEQSAAAAAAAGNWNDDDDGDPSDDLSFMICGMLDVQMNTE